MGVALELRASGTGLQLKLKDEDGVEAGASASCENAAPRDAAAAQSTLARQLAKLGGTPFLAQKVALPAQAIFVRWALGAVKVMVLYWATPTATLERIMRDPRSRVVL